MWGEHLSFFTRSAAILCGASLLTASLGSPGAAQTPGRIAGLVTDQRARPIEGAQVRVQGTSAGAVTSSAGRFRIDNVAATTVTIRVTSLGYAPANLEVSVGSTEIRVSLTDLPLNLNAVVVTGTAGGAELRSVGNAVSQLNVASGVESAPVTNLDQYLNARAPGVVVLPPGGIAAGGARILIRGRSSFSLPVDPVVYVDGVRVDAAGPTGANSYGGASRLNDFDPADIESIEIIKGPAAATLYGTEAANGVIQIITKKGKAGPPTIDFALREGTQSFYNYTGRWLTSFYHDTSAGGVIKGFNLAQAEADAGRPLFHSGHLQGYNLGVRGGTDITQYYGSLNYDNDNGVQPHDATHQFTGRLNLSLTPQQSTWDANGQVAVIVARNNLADGGQLMFNALLNRPLNIKTPTRGFYQAPSETWGREYLYDQNVNRVTTGFELKHRPTSWFSQRLRTGIDVDDQANVTLIPRMLPYDAQFFSALAAAGSKTINETTNLRNTIDYSATATARLRSDWNASTTGGFQYYRTNSNLLGATGQQFPSRDVTSISGASTQIGTSDQVENVTVGGFGQEELAWRDRLFFTAAVRFDRNSAFGAQYKSVAYPKVSASWVISEEPFWHVPRVDQLRLRAAYGASGQQPAAFASLRTFQPTTGQAGSPGVSPQFLGNPNLGPEKSHELELGFEASLFTNRLTLDLTRYDKETRDGIILRDVAPSTGFPQQQYVNIGGISNKGFEMLVKGRPWQSRGVSVDLAFNFSMNDNKVVTLGIPNTPYLAFGFGERFMPGYPAYAYFARKVVSADHGPNHTIINIKCDGGTPSGMPGGPPVDCATAPDVYVGRPDPKFEGAFTPTVTIRDRLTIAGMVDFKRGMRTWSSSLWCPGILGCYEKLYPDSVSAVVAASSVLGYTDDAEWIKDLSFAKLREVSVSYQLPEKWSSWLYRTERSSVSLAARNLHTWTKFGGLDPENVASFASSSFGTQYEQNEVPQLMQFVLKLKVTY